MDNLRAAAAAPSIHHNQYHDFGGAGDRMLATVAEERHPPPRQQPTKSQENNENVDDSDYDPEQGQHLRSPKRQRTGYSCVHCNMTFTEKRALARHKKTDHHRRQLGLPPDRKHACAMCGKHFTRGHDLKRHQNEQHSEQNAASVPEMSSGSSEYSNASTYVEDARATSQASSATGNSTLAVIAETVPLPVTHPLSDATTYAYMDHEDDIRSHGKSFSLSPDSNSSHGRRNSSQPDIKQEYKAKHSFSSPNTSPMTGTLGEGSPGFREKEPRPHDDQFHGLPLHFPEASPLKASSLRQRIPSQPRDIDAWQPMMCMICGDAFEEEAEELIKHLRRHLDNFKGKHRCKDCRIDFTHAKDLERHLQSAAEGHCGFNFPHECTGHHPPGDRIGTLSDYDRVRLFVQLQHWEQAQLQAYIAEINELTVSRQMGRVARDRWSEVIRRSRPNSFCSFAISVNTYATAPCDVTDGKLDLGGLQKRLQSMSLGKPGSRLLRRITPSSEDLRSKTVDKTLQRAVRHGDLSKAQRQIDLGGDVSIIHEDQGPFTTVALWGHGYISRRMAEHRVDEDIMGSCSVCHMNSQTFARPYNKVKSLLKHGANPNEPGGLCGHPLATAAWMGKADIVAMLIEHRSDMQCPNSTYGNALCSVAAGTGYPGHVEVVQVLIDIGADVRNVGPRGSAIELAKERRRYWSMRLKESKDDEEGEMMSRISCCDQVICALQGANALAEARDRKAKGKKGMGMESYRPNVAPDVWTYG